MEIDGLVIGLVVGNITGFIIGTIYVVGTVKKNLARFGKDTMENFFKDAVAMSEPQPVIEEPERNPVTGCPSKLIPVSRPADYTPKHKERK
jgi:hypothetical protein